MGRGAPRGFRGVFRTDDDARAVYSEAAGIARAIPRAIAVPRDPDDVATLMRWAGANGEPLIARGSGSSMGGGAIGDGVIVDLSRLRELGDADAERRCIRVQVGALRGEVDRSAERKNLRFPVDPSSGEFCTIGGMAATNAAGPHSLRHGSMRRWVTALDCVFDDGSIATIQHQERSGTRSGTARQPEVPALQRFARDAAPELERRSAVGPPVLKNSSGYALDAYAGSADVIDLLVGSEGTLAIFTAVELALAPRAPAGATLLVAFDDLERAVEAAVVARDLGVSACELLDRTFLALAARAGRPLPVSPTSEAALLVEAESADAATAVSTIDTLTERLRALGATEVRTSAGNAHESELWSLRHAASPAIARMDASLRSMQFIEDAAVPPLALAEYVRGVRAILDSTDTPCVIFGHAGDAHVHVNPLVDVRRVDWRTRVERILLEVTALVARLGGTLSGEHGDGRLRTPLLDRTWSAEARACFAAIKTAFDPNGILNPGVKVPLRGQRAIADVKYDPTLAALPDDARAALDVVDRERAYSRFRLELL